MNKHELRQATDRAKHALQRKQSNKRAKYVAKRKKFADGDERLTHGELHGHPRWFLDGKPVSRRDRRAYLSSKRRELAKARREAFES